MKSIAATAIVLIAILSAVTLTGIYTLANLSLTQFIMRSQKEMGIVTEINKLEFVKKALDQALVYSFYQGMYDVAKLGGYADLVALKLAKDSGLLVYDDLPVWRVYSSTFFSDSIQNLTNRTSKIFLEYTLALNSTTNVSIPFYGVSVKVPSLYCPKQSYSFSDYEGVCQGTYTCFTEEKSIDEDESPPTCIYYQRKVYCGPGGATDCETSCIFDETNSPLPNWCCWKNSATFTALCYQDPLKSPNLKVKATSQENLKTKIEGLDITDSVNFTKNIKTNFLKLFGIGNEIFVAKDSIKDVIEKGIEDAGLKDYGDYSRCSVCPSKSEVFKKANAKSIAEAKNLIIQKILNKEKELEESITTSELILRLNNDLKEVNISITNCQDEWFTKSINNQQTSWCKRVCDFSYRAAARILVNITDNTKKYPVYDFKEGTTKLRNLQLLFYALSGNSELIYPYNATCKDKDGDKYFDYNAYYCPFGNDCDDYNANKNPGAFDVECNGIDEDCDGSDYCPSVVCSCFETETQCKENPSCEWCKECENRPGRYSGNVNRCVDVNTCTYKCEKGKCDAECDSTYTFEWSGTTCKYNCQLDSSCTFASSCTTKCPYPQSYCLSNNYCYYNVGCSSTGCSYALGDYCPSYNVTDTTCNFNPSCSSTGSCSYASSCDLGECCYCSSSGCVDDSTKCGVGKVCVGCSCV